MLNIQQRDRKLMTFIREKIALVHIAKQHRNVYN